MEYDIFRTCMLVNIGLTRTECATWFQAWASVLSIAGAIYAVRHAFNLNKKMLGETAYHIAMVEASNATSLFSESKFVISEAMSEYESFNTVIDSNSFHNLKNILLGINVLNSSQLVALIPVGSEFIEICHHLQILKSRLILLVDRVIQYPELVEDHDDEIIRLLDLLKRQNIKAQAQLIKFSNRVNLKF